MVRLRDAASGIGFCRVDGLGNVMTDDNYTRYVRMRFVIHMPLTSICTRWYCNMASICGCSKSVWITNISQPPTKSIILISAMMLVEKYFPICKFCYSKWIWIKWWKLDKWPSLCEIALSHIFIINWRTNSTSITMGIFSNKTNRLDYCSRSHISNRN